MSYTADETTAYMERESPPSCHRCERDEEDCLCRHADCPNCDLPVANLVPAIGDRNGYISCPRCGGYWELVEKEAR